VLYTVTESEVTGPSGPVRVRDYIPERPTATSALLWVHGGGFVSGGLDQRESDAPARSLAATGRWVRTLDYRLAPALKLWGGLGPELHPGRFPAAHDDVLAVAASLRSAFGGFISLGGASAGANLAAGVALALRDSGASQPLGLVLAYGTFHADLPERPEVEEYLKGPLARWWFNPGMTRRMHLNYVGDESLLRPGYAFPGGADLRGLPPVLVMNASNDRLRQSGDTFADELRAAGVDVEQQTVRAMHGFLDRPKSPAYAEGIAAVEAWLTKHG
jgi:acetyl esterase